MKPISTWMMLGVFLLICFAVAGFGSWATGPAVRDWYPSLAKPAWTPPAGVFGPVWTVLYAMMAVAAWLVWRRAGWGAALWWWTAQLALNALWSPVFFGLQRPDAACAVIALLWVAIVGTIVMFCRHVFRAGLLLVPYLVWVSFAAALNFAIWRLNTGPRP